MNALMYLRIEGPYDREIRDKARQEYLALALAEDDEVPAEQRRRIILYNFNKADQEDAREAGDTAEEMRLILEAQELSGSIQLGTWEHALKKNFGEEIGAKLANHQIEVGMTLLHLTASFGPPPEGGQLINNQNGRIVLKYGKGEHASYFELDDNHVITYLVLNGGAVLPPELYDLRTH